MLRAVGLISKKLNYLRLFQTQVEGAFDVNGERVFPARIEANSKKVEQDFLGEHPILQHRVIARLLLPALGRLPEYKAATERAAADEANLACALERFRAANGQFPERIENLVPQYIPEINRPFHGDVLHLPLHR